MFINNKKFLAGLLGLTTICAGYFIFTMPPMPIPKEQLQKLSNTFNQGLPLTINANTSLMKTSVIDKGGINSWTFYYIIKSNMAELNQNQIKNITPQLIKQACTTEPTAEVLKHSTVITYQYFTIDQKSFPPLYILPRDCRDFWQSNHKGYSD